jgi:hypothetical protein
MKSTETTITSCRATVAAACVPEFDGHREQLRLDERPKEDGQEKDYL